MEQTHNNLLPPRITIPLPESRSPDVFVENDSRLDNFSDSVSEGFTLEPETSLQTTDSIPSRRMRHGSFTSQDVTDVVVNAGPELLDDIPSNRHVLPAETFTHSYGDYGHSRSSKKTGYYTPPVDTVFPAKVSSSDGNGRYTVSRQIWNSSHELADVPSYAGSTSYNFDDVVQHSSKVYRCVNDHTSPASGGSPATTSSFVLEGDVSISNSILIRYDEYSSDQPVLAADDFVWVVQSAGEHWILSSPLYGNEIQFGYNASSYSSGATITLTLCDASGTSTSQGTVDVAAGWTLPTNATIAANTVIPIARTPGGSYYVVGDQVDMVSDIQYDTSTHKLQYKSRAMFGSFSSTEGDWEDITTAVDCTSA